MERGPGICVGSSASSQQPPPHPTPQPSWKGEVWRAGSGVCRRREERVGGCRIPTPHFWEPLWLATRSTQIQKHPHLPAAMVLFSGPLAQLTCFLADGWQGLVTGTIIPATFLGTQGEGESQTPSPNLPNPSANQISRPHPASACCVILSKRLDLSVFRAIKRGTVRLVQ